jgi:hypothetical protein
MLPGGKVRSKGPSEYMQAPPVVREDNARAVGVKDIEPRQSLGWKGLTKLLFCLGALNFAGIKKHLCTCSPLFLILHHHPPQFLFLGVLFWPW